MSSGPAAGDAARRGAPDPSIRSLFDSLDRDGSGTISADELAALMSTLGVPARSADVLEMLAAVDADGSGDVSFNEFAHVFSRRVDLPYTPAEVRAAFATLAGAGAPPGKVRADDVRRLLRALGPLTLTAASPREAPPRGGGAGPSGRGGRGGGAAGAAGAPRGGAARAPAPGAAAAARAPAADPAPPFTAERIDALVEAMRPDEEGFCDYDAFVREIMNA